MECVPACRVAFAENIGVKTDDERRDRMTVSSRVTVHTYAGNGTQTEWPVLFPLFSPQDVKAIRTGADGLDTLLTYGTDYTVTPLEFGGTCLCSLGNGERLTLFLDLEPVQEVDLSNTGILAPEILERGLDRLTLLAQQQQEQIGRCVQIGRTSGLSPADLLTSIDTAAAGCTANAQAVAVATDEVRAARDEAVAASVSISLPAPLGADAGRGVIVGNGGGWILGGTAGGLNAGDAPEDVATHLQVESKIRERGSNAYAPQSIISALTGLRPAGWKAVECDAPVCTLLADRMVSQTGTWGVNGIISASSSFDSATGPDTMWDNNQATRWVSYATNTEQWLTIDLHSPRDFDAIYFGAAGGTDNSVKALDIYVDGVLNGSHPSLTWSAITEVKTLLLDTPAKGARQVKIYIPVQVGRVGVGTFKLRFTDVPEGVVGIAAGLQVAYADSGRVFPSEVLASRQPVDLSSAPDGIHFIYADITPEGSYAGFGATTKPPRAGADVAAEYANDVVTLAEYANTTTPESAIDGSEATAALLAKNTGYLVLSKTNPGPCRLKVMANDTYSNSFLIYSSSDGVTFKDEGQFDVPVNSWAEFRIATSCTHVKIVGYLNAGGAHTVIREVQLATVVTGDFYNTATCTMCDSTGSPIRRVYLGWARKVGGDIADVHSYALGIRVAVPVNCGQSFALGIQYAQPLPFSSIDADVMHYIEKLGSFGKAIPPGYISGFRGALAETDGEKLKLKVVGPEAYIVSGGAVLNVASGRWAVVVDRGY
ncbi:MAG: discoidin domain-containing protein [Halodesulfovibrio sp.]